MGNKARVNKHLILINSASFVVTHVLYATILVWLQQYLLKRISVAEYSTYPVVASLMLFTPLVGAMFYIGIARYGVQAHASGDERRLVEIVSSSFPITLGVGILLLILGLLLSLNLTSVLNIQKDLSFDAKLMAVLLFFNFSSMIAFAPFEIGLHVKEKFVLHNLLRLLGEAAKILTLFVLLFFVSTRVLWVVVATSVGSLVTLIARTYFSRRALPSLKYKPSYFSPKVAKELLSFGGWNSVYTLAMALKYNTDILILNKLSTPINVTCSYLGRLFQKQVSVSWDFVRVAINPSLTTLNTLKREESLKRAYLRGGRYSLWIVLFVAAPLIILGQEIMLLYVGRAFLPAAVVMTLLIVSMPFEYGNIMMVGIARARGEMKSLAVRSLTVQVLNVVITILVVYYTDMGAIGAAAVTACLAFVFEPLLMWPLGFRLANITLSEFFRYVLKPGLVPAIVTAVILFALKLIFSPDSWLTLFFCAFTGCIVYVSVLFCFCLEPVDKTDAQAFVRQLKQRIADFLN